VELLESGPESPPEVADEDLQETESGLRYFDIETGDGPAVENGQTVNVHYTGWLEDGTRFDSSYSRGQPISYVIGSGGAIAGWEEGISTMNIGGQRLLVIPPELAYGEEGFGDIIPPGSTLIFLVELVEGTR
jgi:peptidylprolyl isomerase